LLDIHVYWNILTMHGPINVKFPNNTSKWQMGFNSAFKGLIFVEDLQRLSAAVLLFGSIVTLLTQVPQSLLFVEFVASVIVLRTTYNPTCNR
jgi:hypothetical protein